MAATTTTTIGKLSPTEVLQEARLSFQKDAQVLPLINVSDISGKPGKTADFPILNTASITKDSSETTDQTTNAAVQPTFATLTVARRVSRIDISDLSSAASSLDLNVLAGRMLGQARLKQVETDVLSNMTTNYTSSVGSTDSTAITPENVLSALLTLKSNEANDNLMLAIHVKQEAHLLDDLVVTSSADSDRSAVAQSAMADGGLVKKSLFGFTVVPTVRVSTGTDTNDIYLGFACNAKELGYAVKNIEPGVELQRDASAGLNEVVMNYYDSSGRIRAAAFVLVKSKTY